MKNKIGVTVAAYKYYDIEEMLIGIKKAGFRFIELRASTFDDSGKIDLKTIDNTLYICKKYGVELFCLAGHGRLMKKDSIINFKKAINIANFMGIKYIDTNTGEVKNEDDKDIFYKEIEILGDYAAKKEVTIGLDILDNWCKNGKIAFEIVKKINHPNIRITYDTGNAIFFGDTRPEDDIGYALPLICNVHIKDKRGGYKVWDFPALGEGNINFDKIFNILKNYNGIMNLEIEFDGKKHPLDEVDKAVKQSYNFLKNYGLVQ